MRIIVALGVCFLIAACAQAPTVPYASKERVAASSYREPGPYTLTVMTMVSNNTGNGAHSSILINSTQRVIFDPAGSFVNERVPERDDVLYGVTPAVLAGYKSAHARQAYHIVSQTFEVTPEQAADALRLAKTNGPVPKMYCAMATTGLLQQVPGFEDIEQTMFPTNLMEQLSRKSGVVEERYFEDDEGTILDGVAKVEI